MVRIYRSCYDIVISVYTKYGKQCPSGGKNLFIHTHVNNKTGAKVQKFCLISTVYIWSKCISTVSAIYSISNVPCTSIQGSFQNTVHLHACVEKLNKFCKTQDLHELKQASSSVTKNYGITVLINSQTKIETIEECPQKLIFIFVICFSVADTHSFPFYSKSFPQLSQIGAYSSR
jgi:hypothetical protein